MRFFCLFKTCYSFTIQKWRHGGRRYMAKSKIKKQFKYKNFKFISNGDHRVAIYAG